MFWIFDLKHKSFFLIVFLTDESAIDLALLGKNHLYYSWKHHQSLQYYICDFEQSLSLAKSMRDLRICRAPTPSQKPMFAPTNDISVLKLVLTRTWLVTWTLGQKLCIAIIFIHIYILTSQEQRWINMVYPFVVQFSPSKVSWRLFSCKVEGMSYLHNHQLIVNTSSTFPSTNHL